MMLPQGRRSNGTDATYEHPYPLRGQFGLGSVLQYSNTPSLRAAGFEDEDSLPDVAFGAHRLAALAVSEVGTTRTRTKPLARLM
jgi:hypothetical protein